jgi:hypothetical protein
MRLSILFVLFANVLFAQTPYLEWINPKTELRQRFFVPNYTISSEMTNGSWSPQESIQVNKEEFVGLDDHIKTHSFSLNYGALVYITINGSQRVYAYDVSRKRISRLDHTWNNGYNYNSTQFVRNDTLYSIGGYGFWHFNKLITYFDSNRKEWELVTPAGEGPETILGGYQGYATLSDVFYSGASELFSDRLGDLEKVFDGRFYRFDFKAKEWTYLGKLNSQLPFKVNRMISWSGKYFLHFAGEKLYILDPSENKVWLVNDGKTFYDNFYLSYARGDIINCYSEVKPGTVRYNIRKLIESSKEIGPMYLSTWIIYRNYTCLLLVLLITGFTGFKLMQFKKNSKGISELALKDQELMLINEFLKLAHQEYLTSNDINEIIGIGDKGLENQRKIRTAVISQINEKVVKHFNILDAIERTEHPEDKRLKLYRLNKMAYEILLNEKMLNQHLRKSN